jgi:hypothetical protein
MRTLDKLMNSVGRRTGASGSATTGQPAGDARGNDAPGVWSLANSTNRCSMKTTYFSLAFCVADVGW